MTLTCSACSRWTILFISIGTLIFTIFFYIGLAEGYDKAETWFKLIRNNCILFYFTIVSVVLMTIYSLIGLIQCLAKEKVLDLAYLTFLLLSIFLKITIIILSICADDVIMKVIGKKWNSNKYEENRISFERNFVCCGFYNPYEKCSIKDLRVYLCGDIVKIKLKEYLNQLRNISIYLISADILPILFASALVCCNDEEKAAENNELESTTSLYNALIN